MSAHTDAILTLSSMGFDPDAAQAALSVSKGNLGQALDLLVGASTSAPAPAPVPASAPPLSHSGGFGSYGGYGSSGVYGPSGGYGYGATVGYGGHGASGGYGSSSRSPKRPPSIIRSPTSQFNVTSGRSACTCIALSAAERFLGEASTMSAKTAVENIVTSAFLMESISAGVGAYGVVSAAAVQSTGVEHMSVEEVFSACGRTNSFFSSMRLLPGMPLQGVVSSDVENPLGFGAVLEGCRSDAAVDDSRWTAVVVTKSPETVLLCLPPRNSADGHYILIDSHPRPQLFGEGSYAAIHSSMDGLVDTLHTIFPPMELGADMGEMMAMMYNSFDAYALQSIGYTVAPAPKMSPPRHAEMKDAHVDITSPKGALPSTPPQPPTFILCARSQFDVADGKPACACITLLAAEEFLIEAQPSPAQRFAPKEILSRKRITQMITKGVDKYNSISKALDRNIEHMSAEEIFSLSDLIHPKPFPSMRLLSRQGMVSLDRPLGFKAILESCRAHREANGSQWMVVIISKSPQSIVACLPPSREDAGEHILIDFHPRPQLSVAGSYVALHESMDGLVKTLDTIFPTEANVNAPINNEHNVCALQVTENSPSPVDQSNKMVDSISVAEETRMTEENVSRRFDSNVPVGEKKIEGNTKVCVDANVLGGKSVPSIDHTTKQTEDVAAASNDPPEISEQGGAVSEVLDSDELDDLSNKRHTSAPNQVLGGKSVPSIDQTEDATVASNGPPGISEKDGGVSEVLDLDELGDLSNQRHTSAPNQVLDFTEEDPSKRSESDGSWVHLEKPTNTEPSSLVPSRDATKSKGPTYPPSVLPNEESDSMQVPQNEAESEEKDDGFETVIAPHNDSVAVVDLSAPVPFSSFRAPVSETQDGYVVPQGLPPPPSYDSVRARSASSITNTSRKQKVHYSNAKCQNETR